MQASDSGHPVLGDARYHGAHASRMFLHAWQLSLIHPFSGKSFEWTSPSLEAYEKECRYWLKTTRGLAFYSSSFENEEDELSDERGAPSRFIRSNSTRARSSHSDTPKSEMPDLKRQKKNRKKPNKNKGKSWD